MIVRSPALGAVLLAVVLATGASASTIYLKSGEIDTSAATTSATQIGRYGAGYYLVALRGPVTDSQKLALTGAGARIVEYIPDFAFLVRIEHSRADTLRKLDCVEWVGPFKSDYKHELSLGSDGRSEQFLVALFPGENLGFVLNKARTLGAKKIDQDRSAGRVLRLLATGDQMTELTKISAVAWIEPYRQPKLCSDVARGITGVPEVWQGLGLYGAGQLIGAADAGLDTGNTATISTDFRGRIAKTYALRRPGDWSDLNGHGTHVMGTLLGCGALSGANPATHSYSGSFAGYAPEASLVFQSIGDAGDMVFPPLYLSELFQPAYDDGVRVHSDSWGSAAKGEYTTYCSQVDQFVWDHKDFTVVFPVGNDGEDLDQNGIIDHDTIYAPATAKNCIAVGATESLRSTGFCLTGYGVCWPSSYPVAPIKYDPVSNNPGGMAAFSGRGPTDDGRVKPDICAPGTNIISSRTHASSAAGWGPYDANYAYWGGTSMSTPQVAGSAALVREYYQREKGISASAALVKATLIAGAEDISPGQYGTGSHREILPAPDPSQGWGRLNLKRALYPDPPTVNEFADESAPLATGEAREYQYTVVNNTVPFVVTLVWTDYPGAVHAAKELVNDLDLSVVTPSGTTLSGTDRINNVEQLRISSPEIGTYKVRVTGYNVPMGPQDYALVVSGGMPSTYIAGTVTSASGAGVQGALISIVAGGNTKRITTNLAGKYMTRVDAGTYSVQIGKPGWTFEPRSRVVTVATAPVTNADFRGQGSPGGLSGHLTSAIGGVTSHIVESPHPYLNNTDQTYIVTAHEGATRMRIHFAEIDLMNDGDTVYVMDAGDGIVNTYTGLRGEDIWSSWVNGNIAKIRILTNDFGNIGYGFYADGYETDLISQGDLPDATLTLTPGNYQAQTGPDGVYALSNIPPGTYTLTPSKPHWKFQPTGRTIEVPAGSTATGADFQGFPPGSIDGQVMVTSSQTQSVNVQSPHPYPENYEQTWQITGSPSATRIRLHFAYISTEPAWDWVYIMDAADNIIEMYTADYTDLWTPWIDGSVAKIMLTSDEYNNYNGFRCDKYEQQTTGGGLKGAILTLSPDSRTATTSSSGTFSFMEVDTGSHTVSPALPCWSFDPPSVSVSISPGLAEHLLFYAAVGDLTAPAQAKAIGDGNQVVLRNVIVTAKFSGFFYVQDSSRTSGVRVVWSGQVTEGSRVDVTGTMATVGGERMLTATSVAASP